MYNLLKKIYHRLKYMFLSIINRRYEKMMKNINILNDKETVDKIVLEGKSISRFGDGEFRWILKSDITPIFQDNSEELSNRLREVLFSDNDNILICIPLILKNNKGFKFEPKFFWKIIMYKYFNKFIPNLKNSIYGNASVSRFYIDYKHYEGSTARLNNVKRIWDNKKILLVEGETTKFGVNNDLLENALQIRRIICPSKNAFNKYDEILKAIIKLKKTDELIMLSLGPTASILAYDLANLGHQAIDIGHLDSEYEWYKRKVKDRIQIPGKSIIEVNKGYTNEDTIITNNKDYHNQIVFRIGE